MANTFRSERLIYRAIEMPQDEEFMHSLSLDIEAFANSNAGILRPPSKAHTKKFIEHMQEKTLISAVICLAPATPTETPTPIGEIHLEGIQDTWFHHAQSEIGVDIIRPYQGQGYGAEAIRWVCNWGFNIANLHRIGIRHFSWNERAGRLYKKLGFKDEGSIREAFFYEGKWHDDVGLGILQHEWRALQASEQEKKDVAVREKEAGATAL